MPSSKSALKRDRQNEKRRIRNQAVKSAMRSQLKKVETAIEEGDGKTAASEMPLATKHLDKAAKRNVIHENQAARRKSRLQKRINKL